MKTAKMAAISLPLCLISCADPIKYNTEQVGLTIFDLQRTQAINNINSFKSNIYAIPSQYELGGGTAGASNNFTAGGSPLISFTGVLIPGLSLSNSSSYNHGWTLTPVTNVTDLSKLQLLYQFAARGRENLVGTVNGPGQANDLPQTFSDFIIRFQRLTRLTSQHDANEQETLVPGSLASYILETIGPLPDVPFTGEGGECLANNPTSTIINSRRICFLDSHIEFPNRGLRNLTASAVQSRFILWVAATTQEIAPSAPQIQRSANGGTKSAARQSERSERAAKPPPNAALPDTVPPLTSGLIIRRRLDSLQQAPNIFQPYSIPSR